MSQRMLGGVGARGEKPPATRLECKFVFLLLSSSLIYYYHLQNPLHSRNESYKKRYKEGSWY